MVVSPQECTQQVGTGTEEQLILATLMISTKSTSKTVKLLAFLRCVIDLIKLKDGKR